MGQLEGRVAVVTGGGRGVGRGVSELLAAEGATVAVNYVRDADAALETVAGIIAVGGAAQAFQGSVESPADCERLANEVVAAFGGIDILVCNAGIASRGRAVADTDADEVWRLVATHAMGPHQLCRHVVPSMRTRGRGDIVFISSVATSAMSANGAPYNMGKAAMEALALTLAKEERRHGIRVNIVAPGLVETDMGVRLARALTGDRSLEDLAPLEAKAPFGRVCVPRDVADAVLFFCSAQSSYVTGQRLEVDGGASRG
jgi:NAD(P)-dependent dehydrogenase (short-subunit alcohol dehydrogenase family)